MNKKHTTVKEIINKSKSSTDWERFDNMTDKEIDCSEIPELDKAFWETAEVVESPLSSSNQPKEQVVISKYSNTIFKTSPQFLVNEDGERISVLLDMGSFHRIVEILNDIEDNMLMDEVENEPRIAWEDIKISLKEKGKL